MCPSGFSYETREISLNRNFDLIHGSVLYLPTAGERKRALRWAETLTRPEFELGVWHRFISKQSKTCLNSKFYFFLTGCLNKAKESHPLFLSIAGRKDRFMLFPRTLTWSETQSASSRIWICVAYSICYVDNRFTKNALRERQVSVIAFIFIEQLCISKLCLLWASRVWY